MQAAFQKHTDNAVSKTVNLPNSATVNDVRKVYDLAYKLGCKGVTIYRDGSRDRQVLTAAKTTRQAEIEETKTVRERPVSLNGSTLKMQTGCGPLYVTINEDEAGLFELFITMGKADGCAASQCEAIGRMVSLAWRSGVQPEKVIRQLMDVACHSPWGLGENKFLSCADAVAKAIRQRLLTSGHMTEKIMRKPIIRGACPDYGGRIVHEESCPHCHCGYSGCG